jgi:hypothetical protein
LVFIFSLFCNSFFVWYSSFGMCLLFICHTFFQPFCHLFDVQYSLFLIVSSSICYSVFIVSPFLHLFGVLYYLFHRFFFYLTFDIRCFIVSSFFVLLCFFYTHAYNNYKYKRRVRQIFHLLSQDKSVDGISLKERNVKKLPQKMTQMLT